MASALTAFLGGAATQATSMIKTEEKNAKELAAAQASSMLKTYMEVDKQSKELSNKMAADVEFMKAYYPEASDDDLVEAAKNPEAMAVFKKRAQEADFDPRIIQFSDFVTVASKNTGKDFKTQINELYDIKKAAAAPVQAAENLSWVQRLTAGTGEAELNRIVSPLGVTPDQLRAAMTYKPSVTSEAKFNLGVLNKTERNFEKEVDKARLKLLDTKKLPVDDLTKDEKISTATKELAMAVAIKDIGSKDSGHDQIVSNLISQIQELPEGSPQRKELQKKLDERQTMEKGTIVPDEKKIRTNLVNEILQARKDGDTKKAKEKKAELDQRKGLLNEEETDPFKITTTNLQVTATKAIAAAVNSFVPAGEFTITTNLDGSQSTSLKSTGLTADYDKGLRAGHEAVYELYTKKGVGVAQSKAHALALAAVGFRIDPDTLKVLAFPKNPRAATPAPEAPPAPAPAKPAAAPTQKLPTPAEFDAKWRTLKSGQSMLGPDGQTHTKK